VKLHRLATYGWYRVSDADAGRLARHNGARLPKHGYELRVQWPDGRWGHLKRTKLIISDEFQNARGWAWSVRLDANEWGRVPEPSRSRMSRIRAQEVVEMAAMLRKAGYSQPNLYARKLAREGIGPHELQSRLSMGRGGVGSLSYTHGFRDRRRRARRRRR
jgi:hypothetical protein